MSPWIIRLVLLNEVVALALSLYHATQRYRATKRRQEYYNNREYDSDVERESYYSSTSYDDNNRPYKRTNSRQGRATSYQPKRYPTMQRRNSRARKNY